MGQTEEDLKEAFAGESEANRKYVAYPRQAEQDGFPQVARLFRAAAESETVHAINHLQVMEGIHETLENLQEAAEGEAEEFREMYPEFAQRAKKAGNHNARDSFDYAGEVEEIHYRMYKEAIEAVKQGNDLPATQLFVCQGCGNTVEEKAPESCPVCGAPKSMFKKVD
jgi:rubrerythrin